MKTIVTNRKARHEYKIVESFEAGIALMGTEVKSLREGKANLRDSYASVRDGELILHGLHISAYSHTSHMDLDPRRDRKLLVKKKEIKRLIGKVQEKGLTLIPLKIYFNDRGIAKVELALAKGKKEYDKRRAIAERDADRDLRRAMKEKY
ncbi:MAG: SsrA-binding protein SmpB [Candidatus Latescibacteria bacterium]|nr:SsrA-binding protein SmpB [Candidatus Latescibacterota bacterium]NIM64503.1 SsrA-binding protein SmpB [Candidatus Latescibacterota bacterium]NIO00656.1 SsrA-binding protein SmpB [Candidatus Latescibacterota bacterium]NIO27059.1 SsrA-binding protein SmpB [Candidatus Latescibacterota bacterium]NIO54583.1 SsrA-binding protein SmpB [Candidatus Latescibacterota bacterium]